MDEETKELSGRFWNLMGEMISEGHEVEQVAEVFLGAAMSAHTEFYRIDKPEHVAAWLRSLADKAEEHEPPLDPSKHPILN